jgi:hypothetical protein
MAFFPYVSAHKALLFRIAARGTFFIQMWPLYGFEFEAPALNSGKIMSFLSKIYKQCMIVNWSRDNKTNFNEIFPTDDTSRRGEAWKSH